MASTMKIRAKSKDGETTVKALMNHPMETGLRKDKATGEAIPAHFIQEVVCKAKDAVVMTAAWSGGISKNPYISFKFTGANPGDSVEITWTDNKGESETAIAEIS